MTSLRLVSQDDIESADKIMSHAMGYGNLDDALLESAMHLLRIDAQCSTILDSVTRKACAPSFSFCDDGLDDAFYGVLRSGHLLEIHGASGCGKTHLALQIALSAALDGHSIVWLAAEPLHPGLLVPMATLVARTRFPDGHDRELRETVERALGKLSIARVEGASSATAAAVSAAARIRPELVVVDSVAAAYRATMADGATLSCEVCTPTPYFKQAARRQPALQENIDEDGVIPDVLDVQTAPCARCALLALTAALRSLADDGALVLCVNHMVAADAAEVAGRVSPSVDLGAGSTRPSVRKSERSPTWSTGTHGGDGPAAEVEGVGVRVFGDADAAAFAARFPTMDTGGGCTKDIPALGARWAHSVDGVISMRRDRRGAAYAVGGGPQRSGEIVCRTSYVVASSWPYGIAEGGMIVSCP